MAKKNGKAKRSKQRASGNGKTRFSYEAVDDSKKRRKPGQAVTQSEDVVLGQTNRRKLIGSVRDLRRNFSVVAWMIRRHLDYVASFRFQSRTGVDKIDRAIERVMAREMRADRVDVRGLFDLRKTIRMTEMARTLDGDILHLLLSGRWRGLIQGVEGDRLRNPSGLKDKTDWFNGVRVDHWGRPLEFSIHKRVKGGSTLQFEKTVAAKHCIHHGYFDRYDQVRGVSPLATAYANLQDVHEGISYARLKAKVSQFFALVFMRDADEAGGDLDGGKTTDENGEEEEDKSGYDVDFGKGGQLVLDLNEGDKADFLESKQPSSEFSSFMEICLLLALKALDLPYSFLREDFTNFFGSRGAWLLYDRSCDDKREDNRGWLDQWTAFKYRLLIADGRLSLPKVQGRQLTVDDQPWEWVPRKMPWWKPVEEIKGNLLGIGGGLTTPQRVCRENDQGDWYENVDEIAKALQYAGDKGVPVSFDPGANPPGRPGKDESGRGKE